MIESKVIHEITPLMGKEVLYIAERRKKSSLIPSIIIRYSNLTSLSMLLAFIASWATQTKLLAIMILYS